MNQEAVGWPDSLGARQVNDTFPPTAIMTFPRSTVAGPYGLSKVNKGCQKNII